MQRNEWSHTWAHCREMYDRPNVREICVSAFEVSWGLTELREALQGCYYRDREVKTQVEDRGRMMLSESAGAIRAQKRQHVK